MEQVYKKNLELARKASSKASEKPADLVKNQTAAAKKVFSSPTGFFRLFFQIKPMKDWMFGIAFVGAILKDIVDPFELTGFLYILVFVFTICCSILIGLMMLLSSFSDGSASRKSQKMVKKGITLMIGTAVEVIPGVGLLPIETLTVIVIYVMVLFDRLGEEEK